MNELIAPEPVALTLEDAMRLAAEAADPDFLPKYAAMKQRMEELEARLGISHE